MKLVHQLLVERPHVLGDELLVHGEAVLQDVSLRGTTDQRSDVSETTRLFLATDLFEHELPEPPDLLAVLGVIHDVVLHEERLRGDNARGHVREMATKIPEFPDYSSLVDQISSRHGDGPMDGLKR